MVDISQIAALTAMMAMRLGARYMQMMEWFKCIAAESPIVVLQLQKLKGELLAAEYMRLAALSLSLKVE